MNMLKVNNVTKKFGKFTALDGVNLDVKEGEIHKRIAYVPGDVNLWPNITGGEVIDLFMSLRGKGDSKKRAHLIEKFELDPSKGNRQKVALIAAFATDTDMYILDEPTSGLDPLMERHFQESVMEVKKAGKSVLLSSHILSEVEKLCDTVGTIRQGKIVESGTLDELRHLTRTSLLIKTKESITNIADVKGVHKVVESVEGLSFQVDTEELDNVMQHITPYGIVKIESAPPTLEDLFMRHYEGTKEVGGVS